MSWLGFLITELMVMEHQMKTLGKQNIWTIANWEKLHQLEDAMNQTRENYTKVFGEVHKVIRQRHSELNRLEIYFSPNAIRSWGGQAAFSSNKWPSKYESWPTGIYIWGVSLDDLSHPTLSPRRGLSRFP